MATKSISSSVPVLGSLIGLGILALLLLGGYFVRTGTTLGILMALSVSLLVWKLPSGLRILIRRQPFLSDLALTGAVTLGVSQLFGNGLTLGISAVVCGLLLSVILLKV